MPSPKAYEYDSYNVRQLLMERPCIEQEVKYAEIKLSAYHEAGANEILISRGEADLKLWKGRLEHLNSALERRGLEGCRCDFKETEDGVLPCESIDKPEESEYNPDI